MYNFNKRISVIEVFLYNEEYTVPLLIKNKDANRGMKSFYG